MSIFAKPQEIQNDNDYGVKVLFLHGLEGSPGGAKSEHLQGMWGCLTPHLRTRNLKELKSKCHGEWSLLEQEEIDEAMNEVYQDALDAIVYSKPDIVVGSSMGAALLYRLYSEGKYSGPGVFLAPAISLLLSDKQVQEGIEAIEPISTSWVLGETDTIVSNTRNVKIAQKCRGNIMFSPNDCHRLMKATKTGLLDTAILTVIEVSQRS